MIEEKKKKKRRSKRERRRGLNNHYGTKDALGFDECQVDDPDCVPKGK